MTRRRACPWPGCDRHVDPWQWGCRDHFARLPQDVKDRLVKTKHWWKEAAEVRAEANKHARRLAREETAEARKCPTCQGPTSNRFTTGECVQCHCRRILGEKPDDAD